MYLQSQSQADQQQTISLSTNISSDLLSTTSCPSLSPSPTPYARSVVSEQDLDFCDPRNLTVGGVTNPTLAPECSAPATLEEFRGEPFTSSSSPTLTKQSDLVAPFDFHPEIQHGLPSFDDISDLESEDDFVNGLVNLGDNSIGDIKRSRSATCSTTVSLGQDPFFADGAGEFDFEDATSCVLNGLPSPASSGSDLESHQDKKFKKSKKETRKASPTMNVAAGTQSGNAEEQTSSTQSNSNENTTNAAQASTPTASTSNATPQQAAPVRRGRKQSLTEDPSKPFVCELCNHRFRRQEHLKRHYRSLHTQEKPFQCNECGKKFSRSDNLAQHARTHGTGAIVMNLIDNSEEGLEMMPQPGNQDYHNFGKVLFQVASEVAGSSGDSSSEDSSSDTTGKKKRKRSD